MPPSKTPTYVDFENEVISGNIKPVYFISASGDYFIKKASDLLRDKLFASVKSNENIYRKYADETKYNEIIDLCQNVTSLFSSKKLVIVRRCEKFARNLKHILEYAAKPDPDSIMVLVFDREYLAESRLDKEYTFYDFSDLPVEYIFRLIREEFSIRGFKINEEELNYFAGMRPFDFDVTVNEIEKISNYLAYGGSEERTVPMEIILKSSGFEKTYTPLDLITSILNRDMKRCMDILHYLLYKAGLNEVYLLSLLTGYYTDLLCFKTPGIRSMNPNDLYKKYGMWRARAEFGKTHGAKFRSSQFGVIFENLLETDKKLKTTMIDPKLMITALIENLINI